MHEPRATRLTYGQEPDYIHIHNGYFHQVANELWSVAPQSLFQLPNVFRLKAANQVDRCLSTTRIPFNLQCPVRPISSVNIESRQLDPQYNLLNPGDLPTARNPEVPGILILQEKLRHGKSSYS